MLPLEPQDGRISAPTLLHRLIEESGSDGIAAELPVAPTGQREITELLEAWYRERSQVIESQMMLGRVEKLLGQLLSREPLSEPTTKQVRQLLQGIARLERHG